MPYSFTIAAWSECSDCQAESGNPSPTLVAVPKPLQRRLTPLAKCVFHAIGHCVEPNEALPAVFSSAHGEIGKSLRMLEALQAGEPLSPTAFSLSVHNGIAGLYSMAYGNRQEISVLAPAAGGLGPGFIEALGMLREGRPHVLLVFYDETLPSFYPVEPFRLSAGASYALALKLAAGGDGLRMCFGLAEDSRHDGEQSLQLPAFIKFLASTQNELCLGDQGRSWQWQKL